MPVFRLHIENKTVKQVQVLFSLRYQVYVVPFALSSIYIIPSTIYMNRNIFPIENMIL